MLWPFAKLEARLLKVPVDAKVTVLVTTGAFNPVHNGHVACMIGARRTLESAGHFVAAGFISPSHDAYVQNKCRAASTPALSAEERCALVDMMCVSSDWLGTGRWESAQAGEWPDFPAVAQSLAAHVTAQWPHMLVTVYYVCGYDHAEKCGLLHHGLCAAGQGVVILARDDHCAKSNPANLVLAGQVADPATHTLSSTLLRAKLQAGQSIKGLVPAAVEIALKANALWDPPSRAGHRRRPIFISASVLHSEWVLSGGADLALADGLFLFGSKRCWLFPTLDWHRAEATTQSGGYLSFEPDFLQLIVAKESRGEVCFLKADEPGEPVDYGGTARCEYARAAAWLAVLHESCTHQPYQPLELDCAWWRQLGPLGMQVALNLEQGAHDYNAVGQLVNTSNPRSLVAVLDRHSYAQTT